MRKLYIFIISVGICFQANAQNFTFTEGNYIEKTIEIESFEDAETKIVNESDVEVTFVWELITFENPETWDYSLCDYTVCYTDGETTGTMTPVPAGSSFAFLRNSIYANAEGMATYRFVVYDQALPDDKDTVTFVVNGISTVGVEENLSNSKFKVISPNNNKELTILNNNLMHGNYEIINIAGQSVITGTIAGEDRKTVQLSTSPSGLYFVRFQNASGIIQTEKIIL